MAVNIVKACPYCGLQHCTCEKPDDNLCESLEDKINNPSHYNHGIECLDYIVSHNFGYMEGNIIKYVTRCKHKGTLIEDLKKAEFYLKRLIKLNLDLDK